MDLPASVEAAAQRYAALLLARQGEQQPASEGRGPPRLRLLRPAVGGCRFLELTRPRRWGGAGGTVGNADGGFIELLMVSVCRARCGR